MIDLPNALELDDGSRVTGIALTPYAYEYIDCAASFVIHRVCFDDDVAPTEAVSADVKGWSTINLLVGPTVGMAMSNDLGMLTDAMNKPDLPYDDRTQHLADALHHRLRAWGAIYEGPERH